jgi:2-oxoglutarate ferredoxin oxidoreductase subunit beta
MNTGINPGAAPGKLTRKDFAASQDVRWCPGCGNNAILAQMQKTLPELGIPRENIVIISGIGCSSRFPYYMNTYGIHSIHGRAPTLAMGLKAARPELQVWVITGDGDGLAIGGNHLIHALRRNIDINILLFNNRIYGLTKGQYSPTSEIGAKTSSSPDGSIENPVNPVGIAIGSEASFIARTVDVFQKHMSMVLRRSADHRGASLVEIAQNCIIFNDATWGHITDPDNRLDHVLYLSSGLQTWARKTCWSMMNRPASQPWRICSRAWAHRIFRFRWACFVPSTSPSTASFSRIRCTRHRLERLLIWMPCFARARPGMYLTRRTEKQDEMSSLRLRKPARGRRL